MPVKIEPPFERIALHNPSKYLIELNWAWFLKQIAPLISKGKPVLVTKLQLNPILSRALCSSFKASYSFSVVA